MIHPNRKPLIASVLWHEHSTVGEVNSLIKRILALYVNVTAVRYPEDHIQTLSVSHKSISLVMRKDSLIASITALSVHNGCCHQSDRDPVRRHN